MYRKLDEAALGTILEAGIAEFARCGFQPASVASVWTAPAKRPANLPFSISSVVQRRTTSG